MDKTEGELYVNLVNKQVMHKIFGMGKVAKYDDSYVRIDFASGNKKFVFPDAFGTFLTLVDQKAADFVEKMVREKEKEREIEEQKLIESRILQNQKRQRFLERERLARRQKSRKIHPRSQSVFWCEAGELDRVFTDWNIFTGEIKSGQKKGQAKRLAQISQNSALLITTRSPEEPEKNRRIVGVFMVNEYFNCRKCTDGYIPAHPEYRLRLTEQESEKMLFWNYYINKRYPHRMTWNTGRHRYFDNIWMAQILRDLVSLKTEPEEREFVQRFFEHYCQANRIREADLPEIAGALKHADASGKD